MSPVALFRHGQVSDVRAAEGGTDMSARDCDLGEQETRHCDRRRCWFVQRYSGTVSFGLAGICESTSAGGQGMGGTMFVLDN